MRGRVGPTPFLCRAMRDQNMCKTPVVVTATVVAAVGKTVSALLACIGAVLLGCLWETGGRFIPCAKTLPCITTMEMTVVETVRGVLRGVVRVKCLAAAAAATVSVTAVGKTALGRKLPTTA